MKTINTKDFIIIHAKSGTFIGLICAILYSFGGVMVDIFTIGLNKGTALAFLALIVMPLIGLIIGLSIGIITTVSYTILQKIIS